MGIAEALSDDLQQARETFDRVCGLLRELGVPGFIRVNLAATAATIVFLGTILLGTLTALVVLLLVPIAQAVVKIIGDVRKGGAPEFAELSAEVLGEMLGVEIPAGDIPTGAGGAGNVERARVIGGKLYDALTAEFTKGGGVTPESGEAAAKAFTGFSINFATTSAFIATLSEMLSLGQLENFREIGEQTAQVLGLGRLQRHVLGVLMKATIETPYTAQLQARYRPNHLSDAQYVRGMHAGKFDEAKVRQELAYQGLADDLIDRMIVELTPHLVESELARLIRYGQETPEDALNELKAQGIPELTAQRKLANTDLARVDSKVGEYINVLENQVLDGFIDLDTFRLLLQQTPLSELEQHWEAKIVGQRLEYPRAKLTLAQVQKALVDGIIDFDYLDQWMQNEGYSIDDQVTLEFLTLEKALAADEAAAKKKAIKDRKLAKQPAKA